METQFNNIDKKANVWVYAISASVLVDGIKHSGKTTTGVGKQPINWIVIETLQVAVSLDTVDPTSPKELELAFSEYEDTLQNLCDDYDCLPMRFGTKMPLVQVHQSIGHSISQYLEKLESCAGCCELSVRWAIPLPLLELSVVIDPLATSKIKNASSGTSYLTQKRDQSRFSHTADRIACETGAKLQRLHPNAIRKVVSSSRRLPTLEPSALAFPTQADPSNGDVLYGQPDYFVIELSLLVLKEHVDALKDAIREERIADLEPTVLSGPWPVHSFV